jgi:hypothetical protein
LPARTPERSLLRSALGRGAQLAVLSSFALAEPLLDILGRNPEFFAVRRSTSAQIVLFALALVLVPPAVLLAVELLVGLASRPAARVLHLVFVAGLAALVVLHALAKRDALSGVDALVVAATGGVVSALLYQYASPVRSFLTVLVPAPLVFLMLFLSNSGISKLVFVSNPHVAAPRFAARTPVVLIVFDEFSPVALMDRKQRIDSERYPNFTSLARDSTWFRSATTVQWLSEDAVPAVLTGILPGRNLLPTYADHPNNVFTLLGRSYRVRGVESLTSLCPSSVCRQRQGSSPQEVPDTAGSLVSDAGIVYLHLVLPSPYVRDIPPIDESWGNFGQHEGASRSLTLEPCARNVCRFASLFDAGGRPTAYVLHSLLPHVPYLYLPSGRRYGVEAPPLSGLRDNRWQQAWPALLAYQRYLLQVEYTDAALGFMLRHLRSAGLYDRALVIVTADHGVSFRAGEPRRRPTPRNLQDIAFVPLFVKLPHQRAGRISDAFVRTIDIVPTIARVLHVGIPWHVDGRPLVGRQLPASGLVSVRLGNGRAVSAPLANLRALRSQALAEQLARFGTTPSDVYRIGPAPELLGRAVTALRVRNAGTTSVELDRRQLLNVVDTRSNLLPTYLSGRVSGPHARHADLAIAVNGRVAAVTRTFEARGETRFAAMVPENSLRDGRNEIGVLLIRGSGRRLTLEQTRGSNESTTLAMREGRLVVEAPGRSLPVEPGAALGAAQVDRAGTVVFSGWAAAPSLRRSVDFLMLFVDGRLVFSAPTGELQPHRVLGQYSLNGFDFTLPRALLPEPGAEHRVRIFAVEGGVASELRYKGSWPWSH